MQTSALNGAGGQSQLIQQLMELARANAIQAEGAQAASSTQSTPETQDGPSSTPAATPASGTTPSDMFSGSTLSALTSAQEGGASYWRQQIDSDVANQMISQLDTDGDGSLSLSEVQNALGGSSGTTSSGGATSGSTSTATVSTMDGLSSAFASLDTNGDGKLSADELTNALNQMQGSGQAQAHHGHHHHHSGGSGEGALSLSDLENALSSLTGALNGAGGSGGTSSNTVSTLDGGANSGGSSTASSSTSTNTVTTLNGLTSNEVAQALQAFLSSLAQNQAANLAALGQTTNPTSVTA